MPWNLGPSVNVHKGRDYWRTWFFEECERAQLFGLTDRHLSLVTKHGEGVVPYRAGTLVHIEDAPYFKASKTHHRVAGPYEVFSRSTAPEATIREFPKEGPILVWLDLHPARGPWLDKSSVTRTIDGLKVRFSQQASRFHFFPYRFAIRHAKGWKVEHIPHTERDCWLCR